MRGSEHILLEVKLLRTPTDHMIAGLRTEKELVKVMRAYLSCSRSESVTMSDEVKAVHWYEYIRNRKDFRSKIPPS